MVTTVREDPMSTNGIRKGALCFAVAAAASIPSIAASAQAMGSSAASDAAVASKINLTLNDLPSAIKWSPRSHEVPAPGTVGCLLPA